MSLVEVSRMIERDVFGAILGALGGVLACRLGLLAVDIHLYVLLIIIALGAWTGAFLAHLRAGESKLAVSSLQTLALKFRQVCLRTMLWLLGAAAVFGVTSVLTESYDLVGRLAGTAAITAMAAGLLWPFSVMMDHDRLRGMGLFGALSVMVSYLLVIPSVWSVGHREEEAIVAAVTIALMLPAGLGTLLLAQVRATRISGLVGTALYAIVMTAFMIAIWSPSQWYSNDEWWETGFSILVFGPMALANLIGAGSGDRRYWRWLGVLAAAVGCFACLHGAWWGDYPSERVLVVISSIAVALAYANVSLYLPLTRGQEWLRIATISMVGLTAVFLDIDLLLQLSYRGPLSLVGRAALAAGILASCGSLALIILAALNRTGQVHIVEGKISNIAVHCPRCGKKQVISLGSATCSRCQLIMNISVQEPKPANPFDQSPGGRS